MSIFSTPKTKTVRKFLGASTEYVAWTVDNTGDCRLSIHDKRNVISIGEWVAGDTKTAETFDKKLAVLVDEINAFRKECKAAVSKKGK